jgi:diguanylate cyclase (GGDEF)-like protein
MGRTRQRILIVLERGTARARVLGGRLPAGRFEFVRWDAIDGIDLRRRTFDLALVEIRQGHAAQAMRLAGIRRRLHGTPLVSFSLRRSGKARARGKQGAELAAPLTLQMIDSILTRESCIAALRAVTARTLRRMKQHESRLRALAAVVRATAQEFEPRRLIDLSMRQVSRFLRLRSWVFHLCDPERGVLRVEQVGGKDRQPARGAGCELGEGLAGRAAQKRRPVMQRLKEVPQPSAAGRGARRAEARSALAVPLLSRGRVIGVVEVGDPPAAADWRAEQAELISFLLEPAAVALDNALLLRRSEQLSCTDDLTKLYNSRFLNATLRREVERSRRYGTAVSLIFLDLDGFKVVNDEHGHLSGSRTLVEVGAVIRETVREVDVVSRYGGDEFTVILPQTGPEGAAIIAERIRARIEEKEFLIAYGLRVRLTASFGIASYPDHGRSKEDLIARADQAMYRVKGRGKNGVQLAVEGDGGCVPLRSAG